MRWRRRPLGGDRGQLVGEGRFADGSAGQELDGFRELPDKEEKEEHHAIGVLAFRSKGEQGRCEADAVNGDHQGPLDARIASQEVRFILGENGQGGEGEEDVDGNENRNQSISAQGQEDVLAGSCDEEGHEKRVGVARFDWGGGEHFAQGHEAGQGEGEDQGSGAKAIGEGDGAQDIPPIASPGIELQPSGAVGLAAQGDVGHGLQKAQ